MEEQETNITAKDSNLSIVSDINKLEIDNQTSEIIREVELKEIDGNKLELNNLDNIEIVKDVITEEQSSQSNEINKEFNDYQKTKSSSSSSEEYSSSEETDDSSPKEELPQKRRRKRKRRKRKAVDIVAYTPDEPFKKRYKKALMELSVKPKLHVKFDETGNVVSYQNNYKPRIISALPRNLSITDSTKEMKEQTEEKKNIDEKIEEPIMPVISLKPRIIKAIGT